REFFSKDAELVAKVNEFAKSYREAKDDATRVAVFEDMIFWLNSTWLAARITYAPRGSPDLNPEEAFQEKKVRCTDLTISTICLLRTFGIAATSVRCPWWPKENSNHTWACVMCPVRHKWLDIESGLPGEKNEKYFARYRNEKNKPIAKAYRVVPGEEGGVVRKTLMIPEGEFWPQSVDRYLVLKPMVDVTSEYTRTCSVVSKRNLPPGTLMYLAVWNDNRWSAVAGARAAGDGSITFEQVGCYDCRYLFAHCVGGGLQPATQPFTLCEDGSIRPDPMPDLAEVVVVASERTAKDPDWKELVDALVKKHGAVRVTYNQRIDEVRLDVALRMPRYVLFVAPPDEASRQFVARVHQFTRALDLDPYGDALWGIVTGYTAGDAMKLVDAPTSLPVRKCIAGTGGWGGQVEDFTGYSEGEQGVMWRKEKTDTAPKKLECAADTTKDFVDALNGNGIDMMWTSGHATERDWQIGYSFPSGALITEDGQLAGRTRKGEKLPIETTNPKVYFAPGNCLIGNIADPNNSMCLSWLRAGAVQFAGYTVPTWYGYMGWGIAEYFFQLQDTFSFSESFFLNNQSLLWDLERGALPADGAGDPKGSRKGHLYDRDVVALYGDPSVDARVVRVTAPRFDQTASVSENKEEHGKVRISFSIKMNRKETLPRPAAFIFPRRLKNFGELKHDATDLLLTDSFMMMSFEGELKEGETRSATLVAEEMKQDDVFLGPLGLEEGRPSPREIVEAHNKALVLLGQKDPESLKQALVELEKILKADNREVTALYNSACAWSLLKDKAKALEYLERAVDAGWNDWKHAQVDTDLETLRDEPAFRSLLDKMGKRNEGEEHPPAEDGKTTGVEIMKCAKCERDLGGMDKRAAFICVEVMGDEYIYSYWFCDACKVYTSEVYHDRFDGESSKNRRGPISREEGDKLVELIKKCPDPARKRCECEAHQRFW
ncbi:MAG: hypothetical protein RDV41_02030, partial [Planctomycetota bacterium]|nr:hypothetical protein [Planctomycetota bacterium]